MDNPAVLLLLLEQGNRSLVDHTRDFIHLVPLMHYPDSSLCTFYRAGLNIATKAQLSGEGLRESYERDDTSPTQDPEPSQPAPRHAEFEPEPTADAEPEPRATELKIATEPEPYTSDQVREPATSTVTGECNMEQVRAMESPAHCTTAGGELDDNSGDLIDFSTEDLENNSGDLIDFFTEISTCHVMPACMESPPTLPLLPMSTSVRSLLSPDSPSAHPQSSTCAVGSPRVCQLPWASGLEDPSSPLPASESRTPPWPSDPAAPPRLSAPSSPSSPIGPPAPPDSLVFSALPWSVVVPPSPQDSVPPAAPRHSVPPAPKDSSLPPAQPPSSVAPAPPRTSGSPDLRLRLGRQSLGLRLGPPDPRCRPGSSALRLGLLRQRLRLHRSAPWSRQPFLHHGSSLRRLHRGSLSCLRSGSPSASPAPGPSCFLLGSFHLRNEYYKRNRDVPFQSVMFNITLTGKLPQPELRFVIEVQMLTGKRVTTSEAQCVTFPTPCKLDNGPTRGSREGLASTEITYNPSWSYGLDYREDSSITNDPGTYTPHSHIKKEPSAHSRPQHSSEEHHHLKSLLDSERKVNTVKVYVAAISHFHNTVEGLSVGKHTLVPQILKRCTTSPSRKEVKITIVESSHIMAITERCGTYGYLCSGLMEFTLYLSPVLQGQCGRTSLHFYSQLLGRNVGKEWLFTPHDFVQ
ncbi:Opioid growth factor receptor [Labeo rohita]|uniref:Opioid growth factor receptor n=1 Tax=Labeo rohita TaxID=84645 RepID=A0ABQ8M5B6_LABRO|nr:Opioid growth factor receptor [Labeo rohita]